MNVPRNDSDHNIGSPIGEPMLLRVQDKPPRSRLFLGITLSILICAFLTTFALGTWQVERLSWKLDLIERVDARVHAAPLPVPSPAEWPQITASKDEYRNVEIQGRLLHSQSTLVQASTVLGSGNWLITPLLQADGSVVLINRGFIAVKERAAEADAVQAVRLTGLLRMDEPGGNHLRKNEPAAERWFSRDIQAIASARGLTQSVAPFFIDAAAVTTAAPTPHEPVGGLTVISFYNHHLVYAITWYTLALMVAGAIWYLLREERKLRRRS